MKKKLFMLAALVLGAVACQKNEAPVEGAAKVEITPVITRATSTNFEQGDQIGLNIVKADKSVYANNACLTYDATRQSFIGDLKWYADGGETCSLFAFYPYAATGMPSTFTVAADQSTGAGASDFMAGAKNDVRPQVSAVSLPFKHYLSQIVINVVNEAGTPIENVVIKDLKGTANIALNTSGEGELITVSCDETKEAFDIKAEATVANKSYRVIVVPQERSFGLIVKAEGGSTLVTGIPSAILKQGYTYTINAKVTTDGIQANISGEITNWEDGGTLGGGEYEVPFEEHLDENYIKYDNIKYNTIKLSNGQIWMAQPLRFIPLGKTVSSDPTADNHIWYSVPATMDGGDPVAATAKYGYLYDYYAIFGTEKITEDNYNSFEGTQGICPKGWHVPTKAEADALVGASESALFYDSALKYATILNANGAGFNYVLSGTRNKTTLTGTGSYLTTSIDAEKAGELTDYIGECSMNYIALSTGYQCKKDSKTGVITNYQYYGIMSTFSKTIHGKLNTAYTNICSGYQVRCVRNSAE